jgi:membrane protein
VAADRRKPWSRRSWIFLWHDVRNFVRRVFEGAVESNIPFLASGLTFDALLAAIPLGFVVLALIGYLLNARASALQVDVAAYLRQLLPSYAGHAGGDPFAPIVHLAEGVVRSRARLSLVGLPLFVWFATRLFGSLRAALCEVFDTRETRSFLRGKLYDVGLVGATGLLFAANALLSEFLLDAEGHIGFLGFFGAQLLAFAFLIALFMMIFKYAPSHRVRWDTALVAALACAVGFELAKDALSFYFRTFVRPDQLVSDRTVGAIILFVGWVYYMTFVFLLGGQIAQVYELRRRQAAQRTVLFD